MDMQPQVVAQNGYQSSSHYTHVLGNKGEESGEEQERCSFRLSQLAFPYGDLPKSTVEYFHLRITGHKGGMLFTTGAFSCPNKTRFSALPQATCPVLSVRSGRE